MNLSTLSAPQPMKKNQKRIGRGPSSGQGCTAGKGNKGAQSRSGYKRKFGKEGGQMPLQRRVPKFGFTNIFRIPYQVVNLEQLERLDVSGVLSKDTLKEKGFVKNLETPIKLLATGSITKVLEIHVDACSRAAREQVEQAGGKVVLL